MGLADLHIHTTYSWDSSCSITAALKQAAGPAGLDVIAITDHDNIEGALEAQQLAPKFGIQVIPGIEISTRDGHLLALFIEQFVPPGLPLETTVRRVGELGGLCVAAHPDARNTSSLSSATIRRALQIPEVAAVLVGIETFNAGILRHNSNVTAEALARSLPVAQVGNSDSHMFFTIGDGATAFPGRTIQELRRALLERQTRAVKGPQLNPFKLFTQWLPRYLLRSAGWVALSPDPCAPLRLGRLAQAAHPSQTLRPR